MDMSNLQVVILAAGRGSRMQSDTSKVLAPLDGKPLILYLLETLRQMQVTNVIVVVGYQKEAVITVIENWLGNNPDMELKFAIQEKQKGTAHAVLCASEAADKNMNTLVLLGDVPMVQPETLLESIQFFHTSISDALVLTVKLDIPDGYGRIIYDPKTNTVCKIIEERDATETERSIQEVNTGVLLFRGRCLWDYLPLIKSNNLQGELYLTDIVTVLNQHEFLVHSFLCHDKENFLGVNSKEQLEYLESVN